MENLDNFTPTVEWMEEKYYEMNRKLFNNQLGRCDFIVFTNSSELGYFTMTEKNLRVRISDRQLYIPSYDGGQEVDDETFYFLCGPLIGITGRYEGSEDAFLNTLVHEMCHYYTYMNGHAPLQSHGEEFKKIAKAVSMRSNGLLTIQRLATAEEMSAVRLKPSFQEKENKKLERKKTSMMGIFTFVNNGEIRLTTTSSKNLRDFILNEMYKRSYIEMVVISSDERLIEVLFKNGYKTNMRKWSYWNVENKDWIDMLDYIEKETIMNPLFENCNRGIDTIITEVINNVINQKMNGDEDEYIDLIPNINYGLVSPFEI